MVGGRRAGGWRISSHAVNVTVKTRPLAHAPPRVRIDRTRMKTFILLLTAVHVVFGAVSAHRAYFQVRRLALRVDARQLREGVPARVDVVSSGRVPVYLSLVVVQGARSETLGTKVVRPHRDGFWNPRSVTDSLAVVASRDLLARLTPGPAVLRATARGTSQWLREPPPEVREVAVVIAPAAAAGRRDETGSRAGRASRAGPASRTRG